MLILRGARPTQAPSATPEKSPDRACPDHGLDFDFARGSQLHLAIRFID